MATGWHRLIPRPDVFRGEGRYRIDAYSEYLPPPRVGWKPYGDHCPDDELFSNRAILSVGTSTSSRKHSNSSPAWCRSPSR